MLNDVHFPPSSSTTARPKASHHGLSRQNSNHHSATADRIRERLPTVERADVGEAIYGEPEDRGDSFNTVFSATVVGIVVLVVVGLAWAVFL
jgi:hypothetical protein